MNPLQDPQELLLAAVSAQQSGDESGAVERFRQILEISPGHPGAAYSLGVIALREGNADGARHYARIGLETAPGFAPLNFLAAAALRSAGAKVETVLEFYDRALAIDPNYIEALINSGVVLRDALRHREALERFNRVLQINPDYTTALVNAGILLTEFKQNEAAVRMFQHLVDVAPDFDYGLGLLLFERLHICDWTGYDAAVEQILAASRAGRRSCKSLAMMAFSDSPADHHQAARIFAEHLYPPSPQKLWNGERYAHDRIRIAYMSPDLREHPVGHLITGVLEQHDHGRFETVAISLGIDDKSRIRSRLLASFDRFVDAKSLNAVQIAQVIRSLEVDILIDLGAYTADSRPEVLGMRPAPVQVNYLGYCGSMAVDYVDYIIADRQVLSPEQWPHYDEKVVYLPDVYMPTDHHVQIGAAPTRAACGLPDVGFVFCAFNHDFKVTPHVFAVWMRLLARTPGSVLWLMSRNAIAQRNLGQFAENAGVDPHRLIFAARVPAVEDHLARYRIADLFLDTFPYNAHTTAADALMAGLPLVTYSGEGFHSRVAGSLLRAVGLPELVTDSLAQYEALASQLADDPVRLAELRGRLASARATSPLFNTVGHCRKLEAIYIAMWRKQQLGESTDAL